MRNVYSYIGIWFRCEKIILKIILKNNKQIKTELEIELNVYRLHTTEWGGGGDVSVFILYLESGLKHHQLIYSVFALSKRECCSYLYFSFLMSELS